MIYYAIAILIASLTGGFLLARNHRVESEEELSEVETQVDVLEIRIKQFRRRYGIVQEDAIDYINSIGAEGSRVLYALGQEIAAAEGLVEQMKLLLRSMAPYAADEVRAMLDGVHPTQLDEAVERLYSLPVNWEHRLESQLQSLGKLVSQASIEAGVSGVPKRPKRKRTLLNLLDAGIRISSDQR